MSTREILLETQEEPDVGAPEPVDRLFRGADRGEVAVRPRELAQQPVLLLVAILVLIDRDLPVPITVGSSQVRVGLQ